MLVVWNKQTKMLRFISLGAIGLVIVAGGIEAQKEEGDDCNTTKGQSGVCVLPEKCPSVYQALMNGVMPDTLCGFSNFDPIICCPDASVQKKPATNTNDKSHDRVGDDGTRTPASTEDSTPQPTTTTTKEPEIVPRHPGDLAKQKCSEYAKSVYAMEDPPILTPFSRPVNKSLCAVTSQKLIVGGTKAAPKEFPHMAAVGFNKPRGGGIAWACGGTLISERFVLTAAHCTHSIEYKKAAWVRVGDLNLVKTDDDASPQDREIIERIRHPGYKKPSTYHDIALLKMDRDVTFNAYVRPACLPSTKEPESPDTVATGWGRVDWTDEQGSNDLLKVTLPLVSLSRCNDSYGGTDDYRLKRGIVDDWQMCAGIEGKDTCQGDSGGPLVVFTSSEFCMYDIVGVTSLGRICGSITPGVYTRVYNYVPWIEETIW